MRILRFILSLLFAFSFSLESPAQPAAYQPGELLVRLAPEVNAKQWVTRWQSFAGAPTQLRATEQLSEHLNIWLVTYDPLSLNEDLFLEELQRKDPAVRQIQRNHIFHQRSTQPNDPGFSNQWQYINTGQGGGQAGADLDIDLAWDITTGGQTALGDTIVVCVIDDGLDLNHQDFGNNIWINHAEIPNNGIDDDQNGFVDDYRGWNARRNNDHISDVNVHGTPVAGIIGAKGNNGIGVSGVNWNVKIMVVVGGINASLESDYIKAFAYPLRQRKLYNESRGKKGAFVVATNGSWGVDTARVQDFPLWSAIYDTLGAYGILNVGAVSNNGDINVDERGDMPASSPSPYLLAVTNINFQDLKVPGAAFGPRAVDLGAYGGLPNDGVWTTRNNNSYGRFPGTSAAAPHVAGAIGLLYAAPCVSFASLARSDPSGAAAVIRDAILGGAKPIPALAGKTVTGGKLNIFNSLQLLLQECRGCYPASSFRATTVTDGAVVLQWNTNDSISRVDLRWRAVGATDWQVIDEVFSPHALIGLLPCTEYEFQINTYCGATGLGYGESLLVKTDGCCEPPKNLRVVLRQEDRFFVRWDPVLAATGYEARYRKEGTEAWASLPANRDGSIALGQLAACTNYELQVRTLCAGASSEFGASFFVRTLGCGFCIDMASKYCTVGNVKATSEWIARVTLAGLDHASAGGSGYRDYTRLDPPVLNKGTTQDLVVVPGAAGQIFGRYTEVFIDYDQNGFFGSEELVFSSERTSGIVSGQFTIPGNALVGITRMRVSMLAKPNIGACPGTTEQSGEVEDYCVQIAPPVATEGPAKADLGMKIFPNPFAESFTFQLNLPIAEPLARISIYDGLGRTIRHWEYQALSPGQFETVLSLENMPAGLYWVTYQGLDSGRSVQRIIKK